MVVSVDWARIAAARSLSLSRAAASLASKLLPVTVAPTARLQSSLKKKVRKVRKETDGQRGMHFYPKRRDQRALICGGSKEKRKEGIITGSESSRGRRNKQPTKFCETCGSAPPKNRRDAPIQGCSTNTATPL